MLFVDVKYANMIGARLRNFKHKSEYLWNASCPVCGDSKTNQLKARLYIFRVKTALFVKCHNCAYSTNLSNFIKYIDPVMHQDYVLEMYKENQTPTFVKKEDNTVPDIIKAPELVDSVLDSIKRLDNLSITHPAVKYCIKRKIPSSVFHLLYFAPRFMHFVNKCVPNKFKSYDAEHPRLIIPFFNEHGKCFAFQGRAFGKEDPKYYTIKLDEDAEKIFGLERINYSKQIYILEGPIDSLFIPNGIAVSGSSFNSPLIDKIKTNATVVYDNEPRSKELTNLIKKTIDRGFSVCLWPDTVVEKDINEMILSGKSSKDIIDIINANTYSGAEAQLRFTTWRKC